ncbi:hypothetical protein, partial [Treponema pedis]|uniref:hypothetical protein n=1 Tax=Treponema pedis TaxID=409322 RepID=UPI00056E6913
MRLKNIDTLIIKKIQYENTIKMPESYFLSEKNIRKTKNRLVQINKKMLEKGLETKEKQDLKIRELNTQKRNLEEKIEKIKKEKKAFIEEIKKEAQKIEKLPSINEKIKQHVACILNNLQPMENSVFNSKIQQVQIKQNLFDKQINCKF